MAINDTLSKCMLHAASCLPRKPTRNERHHLAGWLRTVGRSRVQRGQLPCGRQAQRPATSPVPPPSAAPAPEACLGSWHRPSSTALLLTKGRGGEGAEGCRHPKMDSAGMPAAASGHSGCGPCTWLAGTVCLARRRTRSRMCQPAWRAAAAGRQADGKAGRHFSDTPSLLHGHPRTDAQRPALF
jgi:hypothetical protein